MKKRGFTLSEVLITMAIIGVIAAITLPQLWTNVNETANIKKYKKTMNTLCNIGPRPQTDGYHFDYSNVQISVGSSYRGIDATSGELKQQLYAILDKYGKVDTVKTESSENLSKSVKCIYFTDGTSFCINVKLNGSVMGWVDVNGDAPPNELSECGNEKCSSGKKIRDQFYTTLHGVDAYPGQMSDNGDGTALYMNDEKGNGNASRWALDLK